MGLMVSDTGFGRCRLAVATSWACDGLEAYLGCAR